MATFSSDCGYFDYKCIIAHFGQPFMKSVLLQYYAHVHSIDGEPDLQLLMPLFRVSLHVSNIILPWTLWRVLMVTHSSYNSKRPLDVRSILFLQIISNAKVCRSTAAIADIVLLVCLPVSFLCIDPSSVLSRPFMLARYNVSHLYNFIPHWSKNPTS